MRLVALCNEALCIAAPVPRGAHAAPFLMFDVIVGDGPADVIAQLAEREADVDLAWCAGKLYAAAAAGEGITATRLDRGEAP